MRARVLGFVFQFHHLVPSLTAEVAIARALVHEPPLVLADEPTGNLDTESSEEVVGRMKTMHAERGTAFLVVPHDLRLAAGCERQITLVDGRVATDVRSR